MIYNFTIGISTLLILLLSFNFLFVVGQPVHKTISETVTAGHNTTLNLAIDGNNNFDITEDVIRGSSYYQENKTFSYLYDKPLGNIIYDNFKYDLKNNEGANTHQVTYNLTIIPKPLIGDENDITLRIAISFFISFSIVVLIYLLIRRLIKHSNKTLDRSDRLLDVILEFDWHPSLAFFQFSLWTIIVLVVFLGIYLFNVLSGFIVTDIGSLPANLIIVMGLSTLSSVVSYIISRRNYNEEPRKDYPVLDMLKENGKISLTRVQMFSWTFIGIAYYIILLSVMFINTPISLFNIPDLPQIFIVLMGISQFSYLTGKYISKSDKLQNIHFLPSSPTKGGRFHIYCENIVATDETRKKELNVWFDTRRINYDDILTDNTKIIQSVTSNKIEMIIPEDMEIGLHELLVEQGVFYVKADEKVEVKAPPP